MNAKLLILSSVVLLSGCSLTAKAPPFLLTITPTESPQANSGSTVTVGDSITVNLPLVPQAIANNRVPVAKNGTAIAYIKDAVWVEAPAKLFQRLLAETVRLKTGRPVFDQRQFGLAQGIQLSGQLLHFEIDEASNKAVIVYDATLSGGKDNVVRTRRFEARASVGKIEAQSAGNGLNRAANVVAADVAAWIGGSSTPPA